MATEMIGGSKSAQSFVENKRLVPIVGVVHVVMRIDQAGHDGSVLNIDNLSIAGYFALSRRTHRDKSAVPNDDYRVVDGRPVGAVN